MTTPVLRKRPCPICGGTGYKPLAVRSIDLPALPEPVQWELHDVVCLYCAFVYSVKVYHDSYIEDYYRRTTIEVAADYNALSRTALVERYAPSGSSILEYGPGVSGFKDSLGDGYSVDTVEIGCAPPQKYYDLTAAYYVLEHVPDPRNFIYGMRFVTKQWGFVVVEVPDLEHYPRHSLYPEHLNYFTAFHLKTLLETCGLTVLEHIKGHSREFGMAMVGRVNPCAVTESKRLYKSGRGGCMGAK